MTPRTSRFVVLASALLGIGVAPFVIAQKSDAPATLHVELSEDELKRTLRASPIPSPPADPTNKYADDPAAAHFGRWLFFDQRVSSSGGISCATCHDPSLGFSDAKQLAIGQHVGIFNSPHLWGVAHNRWQFWDGRAETLWQQALGPIENPLEMGASRTSLVLLIVQDEQLRAAYERVFGPFPISLERAMDLPADASPIIGEDDDMDRMLWSMIDEPTREKINEVFVNVAKAIAAFEREMQPPEAPFDRFVRGLREDDADLLGAISPEAQRGLKLFMGEARCHFCHAGPMFTDHEFHHTRVAPPDEFTPSHEGRHGAIGPLSSDEFGAASRWSDDPKGPRAALTAGLVRSPEMWGQFKTPSLRQVSTTMPYMHQGQISSLQQVVEHYSTFEGALPPGHHAIPDPLLEPLNLLPEQVTDLVEFLRSLTGDVPEDLEGPPESPIPPKSLTDK